MELRLRRSPGWPVLSNLMKKQGLGHQLAAGPSSTNALFCKLMLMLKKCQKNIYFLEQLLTVFVKKVDYDNTVKMLLTTGQNMHFSECMHTVFSI